MKNYRILSLLALVLLLALAGGASSLMLAETAADNAFGIHAASGVSATGSTVKCVPSRECGDGPCVPCTPEECAARMGVDVETVKAWMAECKSGSGTKASSVKSGGVQCDPSDCPIGAGCKSATDCKPGASKTTARVCGASNGGCAKRTNSSI